MFTQTVDIALFVIEDAALAEVGGGADVNLA